MTTKVRSAIRQRIAAWQAEGDIDSASELRRDAFLHLRWRLERAPLDVALSAMLA